MNDAGAKNGRRKIGRRRVLALILMTPILFSCSSDVPEHAPQATVFPTPRPLPSFELVDHNGEIFTRESLSGEWSLVFFGFTNCPDICPLTLQTLARARRQLVQRGDSDVIPEIVFVSVDPERDSIDRVAAYVGAFGNGVSGVVGDLDALSALTAALGIFHARPVNPSGGYDVEHSAAVVLINDRAEYHALFSAPHSAESIASDFLQITDQR